MFWYDYAKHIKDITATDWFYDKSLSFNLDYIFSNSFDSGYQRYPPKYTDEYLRYRTKII